MERLHTTRRAASHGALNQTYAVHAGISSRLGPSKPSSRSLRIVNEIPDLLAAPSPLESMLKTTTETGDIGLFTIRPAHLNTSTSLARRLVRPRHSLNNLARARSFDTDRTDATSLGDDSRRRPTHRDTTSEIISMYGYDSRRSICSSHSPAFDDVGQRSYSMTSCSPRPLPKHQSNGTLLSRSSGSTLQRPRSPFPYPTRLKRPGVRPSSPALNGNGGVDYSRMVEIDRVSHRTVHGSYKPTYPHYGRRPPPRACRPEADRPARPLLWGGNPNNLRSPRVQASPSVGQFAVPQSRQQVASEASDDAQRTPSLTSIIEMYRHPLSNTVPESSPPGTAGAMYYDYTEDFDGGRARIGIAAPSSVRFPLRTVSLRQAPALYGNYEVGSRIEKPTLAPLSETSIAERSPLGTSVLENSLTEPDLQEGDNEQRRSNNATQQTARVLPEAAPRPDMVPDLEERGEESNEYYEEDARLNSALKSSPGHKVEISSPDRLTMGSIQAGFVGRDECGDDSESRISQETVAGLTKVEEDDSRLTTSSPCQSISQASNRSRSSFPSYSARDSVVSIMSMSVHRNNKYYSIDPGLSDLASFVNHLDEAGNIDTSRDISYADRDDNSPLLRNSPDMSDKEASVCSEADRAYESSTIGNAGPGKTKIATSRRGRGLSALNVDSEDMLSGRIRDQPDTVDRSRTPMLAPQPISPARQLRVKNSIPQLMKALPPLPAQGTAMSGPSSEDSDMEDLDFSLEFPPFRLSRLPSPKPVVTRQCLNTAREAVEKEKETTANAQGDDDARRLTAIPKAKLKLKTSASINSMFIPQPRHQAPGSRSFMNTQESRQRSVIVEPRGAPNGSKSKLRPQVCLGNLPKAPDEEGILRYSFGSEQSGWSRSSSTRANHASSSRNEVGHRIERIRTALVHRFDEIDEFRDREENGEDEQENAIVYTESPIPSSLSEARRTGTSLDVNPGTMVRMRSWVDAAEETGSHHPSDDSIHTIGQPVRGLRKKISGLWARSADPRTQPIDALTPRGTFSANPDHIGPAIAATSPRQISGNAGLSKNSTTSDEDEGEARRLRMQRRGLIRRRMSKWMRSARQALKAVCAKRRGLAPRS